MTGHPHLLAALLLTAALLVAPAAAADESVPAPEPSQSVLPDPAEPAPEPSQSALPDPAEPAEPAEPDPAEPDPTESDPGEPNPDQPGPGEPESEEPGPEDPEPGDPEPELTEQPPVAGLGPAGARVGTTITVGRSAQGRRITARYRGHPEPTQVLVVLGQMHGDEKAGVATANWIGNHVTPKRGTGIWVVPTMNPDGNARGSRTNARGVDLNRNWPTSGWQTTSPGRYWSGPGPGSEPETKAMMRFLKQVKPDYIASIHQPLYGIGRSSHDVAWEKRLARQLNLPRKYFGISQGEGVSPTLTGWYNHHFDRHGTATTIEYGAAPGQRYRTRIAGLGIARAAKVR